MISDQRIAELADRLLADGELDNVEADELRAALAESDAARLLYLKRCGLNLALADAAALALLADPSPLPPPTGIQTVAAQSPAHSDRGQPAAESPQAHGASRWSAPWTGIGIAALLMFGSVGWWFVSQNRTALGPDSNKVGAVLRSMGDSLEWSLGETLYLGEQSVGPSRVEFRLDDGVLVAVQGPARFSFSSADHMRLITGRMSAMVPPGAEGFRVDTDDMEVTDLGTRFAVTANGKGDTAVHVYDGRVTAGVASEPGRPPEALAAGTTVQMNSETGQIERIAYLQDLFVTSPATASSIDWHGPDISVLESPPGVISPTSHRGRLLVFRERSRVALEEALAVDIAPSPQGPVIATGADAGGGAIPAGHAVSSYLIQYTPANRGTTSEQALIRFDSRILGIVCAEGRLSESDDQFSAPDCEFTGWNHSWRGLEGEDQIELMSDGRTMHIHLSAPFAFGDQLRVIVADD